MPSLKEMIKRLPFGTRDGFSFKFPVVLEVLKAAGKDAEAQAHRVQVLH